MRTRSRSRAGSRASSVEPSMDGLPLIALPGGITDFSVLSGKQRVYKGKTLHEIDISLWPEPSDDISATYDKMRYLPDQEDVTRFTANCSPEWYGLQVNHPYYLPGVSLFSLGK